MRRYLALISVLLLFSLAKGFAQVPPQTPNKINKAGKREGPWIIWFDKNSRRVQKSDSITYYRTISYKDGNPEGLVRDYYSNGKIKWEGYLVSDQPIDMRNGKSISYDEIGNKTEEAQYNRIGKKISFIEYKSKSVPMGDTLVMLLNEGNSCLNQGRYVQASRFWEDGLSLAEKKFGKNDENYATFLNALALLYQTTGNYDKGENLNLQALKIMKSKLSENSPAYAISVNNLGLIYWLAGKYDLAEGNFLLAIKIFKDNQLANHPHYSTLLNNLGTFYLSMGNHDRAKMFLTEAIQTIYGPNISGYTTYLNNLADVYLAERKYSEAEGLIAKAVRIDRQFRGDSSVQYAQSLSNLGSYYFNVSKFYKAKLTFDSSMLIYRRNLGESHPYFATIENSLGAVCQARGDFERAERYYLDAAGIMKNKFGERSDRYASCISLLATLSRDMNKLDRAESYFIQSNENLLARIHRFFPTLSEKEKDEFFKVIKDGFDMFNSFAILRHRSNPRISEEMFNMQLATKALLLNSSAKWKQRIRSSGDKKLIALYYSWEDKQAILTKLFKEPDAAKRGGLDSLQAEINQLEKELSKRSEFFSQISDRKRYTWQDVQQKLLPNEAAIEIIRLRKYGVRKIVTDSSDASLPQYPSLGLTDTVYYAALVIVPTSKYPDLVVLTNGNELERKNLLYYRNSIKFQNLDERSYDAFWKPISKALGKKIKKIYFSPDGVYNSINLNTLFNTATKKYLLDEVDLQLLTTSKDLVTAKKEEDFNTLAYLFGYPNYEVSKENRATLLKKERSTQPAYYSLNIERGDNLVELPATKKEVENVAAMLSEKGWHPQVYMGESALEENIKDIFKPRVLHIATHGYFQPDSLLSAHSNPLVQSGLMLTGAGRTLTGDKDDKTEDGILTAYEAMNLNLDNTDLVVLSACETGLGQIRNGEGVYGLQRAFKVAGARTIVMSLWKVNDEATQELISEFYKAWLDKGNNKQAAFKRAQLILKAKYPDPYFWGAFVMVGN
jgi:CHAT domain-containing protein/Tfp pilus assembly protein PilF/antitoxin component YwqK of YwqJK toxin-antitoxin module